MRAKRCKKCKWVVNTKNMYSGMCSHEKRMWDFCSKERYSTGNCGFHGKHWEAKDGV